MKLNKLAEKIGAKVLNNGKCVSVEIDRIYAGDKMSDLLNEASETTLIVTNLANLQLLRFAEIMDVPGICLLKGVEPESELINAASNHGTMIIVSPHDIAETCGRLHQCLREKGESEA